ncbi:uncharacterized protein [Melanerpes formicivorus]|uniref:uncharacterized protein isoform X2 n=1 Tax=Melanerpes formicivorus TaxID=211600 RepID=UPI00358EBEFD
MERVRALLGRVWRRQRSTCDSLRKEEEEGRDEFAQLQGMEENLPAAEKMEDKNSSWQDPVLPFVEEDSGSVLPPVELPEQDNLGAGLQPGALPKARRSLKGLRRWAWKRNHSPSSSTSGDSLRTEAKEEVRGELAQLQSMEEELPAAKKMEDKNSSWQDPVLPFVEEDSGSSGSVLSKLELPSQDDMGAGLQPGALPKARRSLKGLRRWAWKRNHSPSSSTSGDSLRTEAEEEVRGELAQLQSMEEELPAAEAENDSSEDPEDLFTKPSVRQPRHELTRALQARHWVESLLQVWETSNNQLKEKNVALENEKAVWAKERKAYKEKVKALQEENAALQKKNLELQEELERL